MKIDARAEHFRDIANGREDNFFDLKVGEEVVVCRKNGVRRRARIVAAITSAGNVFPPHRRGYSVEVWTGRPDWSRTWFFISLTESQTEHDLIIVARRP